MATTRKAIFLLATTLFLFIGRASCFTIFEQILVGLMVACPCPDEIVCKLVNATQFSCEKLENVDECETPPIGIAECVLCIDAGLEWCQVGLVGTNSGFCAENCTTQLPLPFLINNTVTCTDDCPSELLCPDCVGDDDDDAEVKIKICHKPGTPAEKTLKVPPQALPGHLGHGDTIGSCGSHKGELLSGNELPQKHNTHTFVKNSGNTLLRNSLMVMAMVWCLVSMVLL